MGKFIFLDTEIISIDDILYVRDVIHSTGECPHTLIVFKDRTEMLTKTRASKITELIKKQTKDEHI